VIEHGIATNEKAAQLVLPIVELNARRFVAIATAEFTTVALPGLVVSAQAASF